jgi:hypothetical protein
VASKNARALVFSKSDGAGKSFWSGLENVDFSLGRLPLHVSTSPEKLVGQGLMSTA